MGRDYFDKLLGGEGGIQPTISGPVDVSAGATGGDYFSQQLAGLHTHPGGTPPVKAEDQSVYDVTVGAAALGGAETVNALVRRADRLVGGSQTLQGWSQQLEEYKRGHPEYAPAQVDSTFALLTSPKALISRFTSGLPQMVTVAAASEVPVVGMPLAFGLSYAIESQNAYDNAKAAGASDDQAYVTSEIVGTVNGALSLFQTEKALGATKEGIRYLSGQAIKRATQQMVAQKIGSKFAKEVAGAAIVNAIMGAVNEGVPTITFGKAPDPGFLDRRLQDATVGAFLAGLTHAPTVVGAAMGVGGPRPEVGSDTRVQEVFGRSDVIKQFREQFKWNDEQTNTYSGLIDSFAKTYSRINDVPLEQAYTSMFAKDMGHDLTGAVLFQGSGKLHEQPLPLMQMLTSDEFYERFPPRSKILLKDMREYLEGQGVTPEQLIWHGMKDRLSDVVGEDPAHAVLTSNDTIQAEVINQHRNIIALEDESTANMFHNKAKDALYEMKQGQDKLQTAKTREQQIVARQRIDQSRLAIEQLYNEVFDPTVKDSVVMMLPPLKGEPVSEPADSGSRLMVKINFEHVTRVPHFADEVGAGVPEMVTDALKSVQRYLGSYKPSERIHDIQRAMNRKEDHVHWFREMTGQDPSTLSQEQQRAIGVIGIFAEHGVRGVEGYFQNWLDRYGADAGAVDWRPNETVPEDYYAGGGDPTAIHLAVPRETLHVSDLKTGAGGRPLRGPQQEIVFGRILMHAVEQGYDKVEFEQHIDHNLNGHLDMEKMSQALKRVSPHAEIEALGNEQNIDLTAPQYGVTLDDKLKSDLANTGFDLTEKAISSPKISQDFESLKKMVKTPIAEAAQKSSIRVVEDKTGHLWVMDSPNHARIQFSAELRDSQILSTGWLGKDEKGNPVYKGVTEADVQKMYFQNYFEREVKEGDYTVLGKKSEAFWTKQAKDWFYQDNKGMVAFLQDGRAIIRALNNPDASTPIHELAHVARRQLLVGEDLKTVEDWAGVKDGKWERDHEEKFARAFERYIRDGLAPTSSLVTIFDKLAAWVKNVYRTVTGDSPLKIKISDEVRGVFDRLLIEDSDPVKAKRMQLADISERLEKLKNPKKLPEKMERAQLELAYDKAKKELQLVQQSQFTKSDPSPAARRAEFARTLPKGAELSSPENFKIINGRKWWWHAFKEATGEMIQFLHQYKTGRQIIGLFDDATVYRRALVGELNGDLKETVERLGSKNANWLKEMDEDGWANFQRVYDEVGVPESVGAMKAPNESVTQALGFLDRVVDKMTDEAIEQATLRKLPSGDTVLLKRSSQRRLPRILTQDAWEALERKAGPIFNAMVEAAMKWNDGLRNNFDNASAAVENEFQRGSIRKFGTLEQSRAIKYMPAYVKVDGAWMAVFHTEPYHLLSHTIERQAARISFVKYFGQNVLKNLATDKEGVLRKGAVQSVLRIIDKSPRYTKDVLMEQLMTETGAKKADLEQLSYKDLRAITKEWNMPVSPTAQELHGLLLGTSIKEFKPAQIKKLRTLAKKMGGIDSRIEPAELLTAVKERATTAVEDDLLGRLRTSYGKEGGNTAHVDAVARVWQGLPYGWLSRNPLTRSLRLYSAIVGTAQTSLSSVKNLLQTPIQVPALGGMVNYFKAIDTVFHDYDGARTRAITVGAFTNIIHAWTGETGYQLEQVGKNFQQKIQQLTGFEKIAEMNNLVAAETGRSLADNWRKHGFQRKDIDTARSLLLSEPEIDGLLKRDSMTDHTYKKIIQNMVARTQGVTEAPHRRALLESIPVFKTLFAYSSYSFLQTRALGDHLTALKDAYKSGEPGRIVNATRRFSVLMGASVGIGLLGRMLVGSVKGQPPRPDDKDWWNQVAGAAAEVQMLGAMNRVVEPFDYAGGSVERAILGLMPQLSAISSVIGVLGHFGKFGRFPIETRAKEAGYNMFPLVKAVRTWTDKVSAPEFSHYLSVKGGASQYEKDVLGQESFVGDTQLNPEYYDVFNAVARNDGDTAIQSAKEYYQRAVGRGVPHYMAVQGLRQSLLARRPINMEHKDLVRYIGTLSGDKKQEAIATYKRYMGLVNRVAPSFS